MSERRDRGVEMIKEVYAGDVVVAPEGAVPFSDVMLEQLFAEVWTRGELSMRDRRLLLLGVIAALGEGDAWLIQVKAASIVSALIHPHGAVDICSAPRSTDHRAPMRSSSDRK